MLISAFAFVFAIFFPKKINILTKETNVNECNEKKMTWTTRMIKERQFRMRNKSFLAFQRDKHNVVAVTYVPQSFMWRCGRSLRCSHSKRLQRVVYRTPATVVFVVVKWSLYLSLSRFCDVVVLVFVVVVQNDCKESFTEGQQRPQRKLASVFWANWRGLCTNECISFLAAKMYKQSCHF